MADILPSAIQTAADYEALAQARIEPAYWRYLSAGTGLENTLRANQAAFDAIKIYPRMLRGQRGGDTRLTLLGRLAASSSPSQIVLRRKVPPSRRPLVTS